jgi:hypothetical protein
MTDPIYKKMIVREGSLNRISVDTSCEV